MGNGLKFIAPMKKSAHQVSDLVGRRSNVGQNPEKCANSHHGHSARTIQSGRVEWQKSDEGLAFGIAPDRNPGRTGPSGSEAENGMRLRCLANRDRMRAATHIHPANAAEIHTKIVRYICSGPRSSVRQSQRTHSHGYHSSTFERVMFELVPRLVEVIEISELTPHMRRFVLQSNDLKTFDSQDADDHMKLLFPSRGIHRAGPASPHPRWPVNAR